MPGVEWWLLHAAQAAAMVLALSFALVAARRAGGHTLYGNMLFLLALGFWSLLMGEALFAGRQAVGAWNGPGGFNEIPNLLGWLLLLASLFVFVERFTPVKDRPRKPLANRLSLAATMAIPVVVLLLAFRTWISPPGADPNAALRFAYLAIDALTLGVIIGGLDRFLRLRNGALGRLYVYLAAALVIKATADMYWAYLAARGQSSLVATALGPIAGLVAVVGLGLHVRHMRQESIGPTAHLPWLHPHQQRLAALAQHIQGIGGGYAARTALLAAGAALQSHGASWKMEESTIQGNADAEAWMAAIEAAERVARDLLGSAAADTIGRTANGGATWAG